MAQVGSTVLTKTSVAGSDGVTKYSLAWTSDASGNVSGNSLAFTPGSVVAVEFIPAAGGSAPTDLYDVGFLDGAGTSMFDDGAGASIGLNLSGTLATHRAPFINGASTTYVRAWLQGSSGGNPYQLTVANAGAAKSGTVNIYVSYRTL
jgi:hypothetical protein